MVDTRTFEQSEREADPEPSSPRTKEKGKQKATEGFCDRQVSADDDVIEMQPLSHSDLDVTAPNNTSTVRDHRFIRELTENETSTQSQPHDPPGPQFHSVFDFKRNAHTMPPGPLSAAPLSSTDSIRVARSATTLHGIPINTTTAHLHPTALSPHRAITSGSTSFTPANLSAFAQHNVNGSGSRNAIGIGAGNGIENEAVAVRRNMLRGAWAGFGALGRGRRYVLMFRVAIALAQVAAGITVLSLPTSLGDSFARPEICDPEGMFVFLTLHVIRVICCIPIDVYLGLSPHRNSRARRVGAQGQEERERNRPVGNLVLDRKLSRLNDLFGFIHVVLFVVGNYLVYSSTECSKPPADSVALFWTSFSMLAVSYFVILEIALLVFAVVFFLPALVALLRALGFAGNLVNPNGINPETGKVGIEKVDDLSKLYYFTAQQESEIDDKPHGKNQEDEDQTAIAEDERSSLQQLRILTAANAWKESLMEDSEAREDVKAASQIPLPVDHGDDDIIRSSDKVETREAGRDDASKFEGQSVKDDSTDPTSSRTLPRKGVRRFWTSSPSSHPPSKDLQQHASGQNPDELPTPKHSSPNEENPTHSASTSTPITHSHPLLPLPSHRSTCPICLDDYKEPSKTLKDQDDLGNVLEPLRLLPCNHALHKSCVDQWLTTVSGRCPVCQRPIIDDKGEDGKGDDET